MKTDTPLQPRDKTWLLRYSSRCHGVIAVILAIAFLRILGQPGLAADFAADVASLRKMSISDLESLKSVDLRSQELCEQYSDPVSQAEIRYTAALVHTRNGHKFPKESNAAIELALNNLQPPQRELQLTMYLGDSISLQPEEGATRRRRAAEIYLRGLRLCEKFAKDQSISENPEASLAVEQFRMSFERQLAWIYHDRAADLNELRDLLNKGEQDQVTIDRVVTQGMSLKPKEKEGTQVSSNFQFQRLLLLIANVVVIFLWILYAGQFRNNAEGKSREQVEQPHS